MVRFFASKQYRSALVAALLLLLAGAIGFPGSLGAAESAPPQVEPAALNRALDEVLQRREFAWRLPREIAATPAETKSWLTLFAEALWKRLTGWMRKIAKGIGDVFDWIRRIFWSDRSKRDERLGARGIDWSSAARWTLGLLIAALLAMLGVLLWRWRGGLRPKITAASPVAAIPDLNAENVTADQLPEDGWLRLARELIDSGELRLAMRASYLAGLAHLGSRELIQLARHKSNHDYDRELRRRARAREELLTAFAGNLAAFERSWYGAHEVTAETLGHFSENLQRIRAC